MYTGDSTTPHRNRGNLASGERTNGFGPFMNEQEEKKKEDLYTLEVFFDQPIKSLPLFWISF